MCWILFVVVLPSCCCGDANVGVCNGVEEAEASEEAMVEEGIGCSSGCSRLFRLTAAGGSACWAA